MLLSVSVPVSVSEARPPRAAGRVPGDARAAPSFFPRTPPMEGGV